MITGVIDSFQALGHLVTLWLLWKTFKGGLSKAIIVPKITSYLRLHLWPSLGKIPTPLPSLILPSPKPQRCLGFQLRAELGLAAMWGVTLPKCGVGMGWVWTRKLWKVGGWRWFLSLLLVLLAVTPMFSISFGIWGISLHSFFCVVSPCVWQSANLKPFFCRSSALANQTGSSHPLPHKRWVGRIYDDWWKETSFS